MAKSAPDGWHTITPRLVVRDAPAFVAFLRYAFGADGDLATEAPSVMRIGDSIVMISGAGARRATAAFLYIYVDDVDATFERALEAGAAALEAPWNTPYGDRRAMIKDPSGNDWQIATHGNAIRR